MDTIIKYLLSKEFYVSLAVFLIALGALFLLKKGNKKLNAKSGGGRISGVNMLFDIARVLAIFLGVVIILQINGVNISSLVTGLGVVGIIAGFAVQDLLKDLIMGVSILVGNFFSVGDVVEYDTSKECRVIGFTVKTTKLYDVNTGDIISVCNRNISQIRRISDWLDVTVLASYTVPAERMRKVCSDIAEECAVGENVEKAEFLGTEKFGESSIEYTVRIYCKPEFKPDVRRFANGIIQDVYAKENLAVPFNQLDVHIDK